MPEAARGFAEGPAIAPEQNSALEVDSEVALAPEPKCRAGEPVRLRAPDRRPAPRRRQAMEKRGIERRIANALGKDGATFEWYCSASRQLRGFRLRGSCGSSHGRTR